MCEQHALGVTGGAAGVHDGAKILSGGQDVQVIQWEWLGRGNEPRGAVGEMDTHLSRRRHWLGGRGSAQGLQLLKGVQVVTEALGNLQVGARRLSSCTA